MTLEKIYKRTSTGKIQEWEIEIEGAKYRTIAGQQGGKKVTSTWTTCLGKNLGRANATTAEEQALAEATAKRRIKLEHEYREDLAEIDNLDFLTPMLAEDYDAEESLVYPVFIQPKLDGIRCIATEKGLFSRKGKPIVVCPHIQEITQKIFKDYGVELDGELYNPVFKDDFDSLASIVRQLKPTEADFEKSKALMHYHVYDIRDKTKVFSERSKLLAKIVAKIDKPYFVFVETHEITNKSSLDSYFKKWRKDGYEGQMIRTDSVYEFKRTTALLKRKDTMTDEFDAVDVLEGKGNRSGMAGKIVVKLHKPTTNGVTTCEANPKGTFEFYKKLLKDKKLVIGKKVTVEFQGYTPKGSLRFPRALTIRDYE